MPRKADQPKEEVNGTCRKGECPLFRKYGRQCPMLVTNSWLEPSGKTKQTEDCAPITGMQMQQEMHNRVVAVQKAQEETREQFSELARRFSSCIEQTQEFITKRHQKRLMK